MTSAAPSQTDILQRRDLTLDLARVACVFVVVIVHILFTGVGVALNGTIVVQRTVEGQSWFDVASWIADIMPLFFVIGGFAACAGWRSAQRRGADSAALVRVRLQRLARPALVVFVFFAELLTAITALRGLGMQLSDIARSWPELLGIE